MDKIKILCIIPAYNEAGNLKPLTIQLIQNLKKISSSYQLLFIIQGNDKSDIEIKKLQKKYPKKIKADYFTRPLGIGLAYKIGFDKINKSITHVLTLDADLNHNPKILRNFFIHLEETKSDIVVGSRFIEKGAFYDKRLWKRIISRCINLFLKVILDLPISDATSGYRLIRSNVITTIRKMLNEKGYPAYLEFILISHKSGFRISEIPIIYTPRVWGKSKMNKIKTFKDYLLFFPKIPFIF